jgi:hypothetical protein
MKAKFKILAVAVAMATGGMLAAGTAQAAPISVGGYNPTFGPTGTGAAAGGNVIFTVYDPSAGVSLALNTNKTVLDMVNANTSFSISDAGLASFLTAHAADQSSMIWNMGAVSNGPSLTGVATTNGNDGNVWNPAMSPLDGYTAALSMDNIFYYAGNNNGFLGASNSYVSSPATSATGFAGGSWGFNFGGVAGWGTGFDNTLTGLNGGMKMTFLAIDPNSQDLAPIANTFAGTWSVNAAAGTLNYNVSAVPVPAAVWLFGSGLLGLVGIGRRKKA